MLIVNSTNFDLLARKMLSLSRAVTKPFLLSSVRRQIDSFVLCSRKCGDTGERAVRNNQHRSSQHYKKGLGRTCFLLQHRRIGIFELHRSNARIRIVFRHENQLPRLRMINRRFVVRTRRLIVRV